MTKKELIDGSDLVLYEYKRLIEMTNILIKVKSKGLDFDDPIIKTAVHESWVVHFRCLYYFFNPERNRRDEFIFKNYLSEKEITDFTDLVKKWKDRRDWKNKADRQLAHISKKRLDYNIGILEKKWFCVKGTQEINKLFYYFLELVDNEKLYAGLIEIKADPKIPQYSQHELDMCFGNYQHFV